MKVSKQTALNEYIRIHNITNTPLAKNYKAYHKDVLAFKAKVLAYKNELFTKI